MCVSFDGSLRANGSTFLAIGYSLARRTRADLPLITLDGDFISRRSFGGLKNSGNQTDDGDR
jgi:hypothetical protein